MIAELLLLLLAENTWEGFGGPHFAERFSLGLQSIKNAQLIIYLLATDLLDSLVEELSQLQALLRTFVQRQFRLFVLLVSLGGHV